MPHFRLATTGHNICAYSSHVKHIEWPHFMAGAPAQHDTSSLLIVGFSPLWEHKSGSNAYLSSPLCTIITLTLPVNRGRTSSSCGISPEFGLPSCWWRLSSGSSLVLVKDLGASSKKCWCWIVVLPMCQWVLPMFTLQRHASWIN